MSSFCGAKIHKPTQLKLANQQQQQQLQLFFSRDSFVQIITVKIFGEKVLSRKSVKRRTIA